MVVLKILGNIKAMAVIMTLGMAFQGFALENTTANNVKSVDITGITSLTISYTMARLSILESDTDELVLKEYTKVDAPEYLGNIIRDGSVLSITGAAGSLANQANTTVEVYIPPSYRGNCTVRLSSGAITSETDLRVNNLTMELFNGPITLGRVSAEDIYIKSSNGDIKMDLAEGRLRIDAVSGSIKVQSAGGEGTFRASLGGITVGMEYVTGDLSFETGIGGITLSLPANLSFNIDALTGTGNIRLDAPDQQYQLGTSGPAKMTVGPRPLYTIRSRTGVGNIMMNMNITGDGGA